MKLRAVRIAVAWLLAIACIVVPITHLISPGPFAWHLRQEAMWQGGIEVLVVGAAILAGLTMRSRWGVLVALAASALYARRHGVDLSIAVVALYVEALFAIGWRALPWVGMQRSLRPHVLLVAVFVGIVAWSLVLWTLGALGVGDLGGLRLVTLAVLGLALAGRTGPLLGVVVAHRAARGPRGARIAAAMVATTGLMLFAKASVVVDYDSLWYGLQADEVLVGGGDIYAGEGLASVVHYYPKVFEVLLLPVSGLDSISLPFGVTIAAWLGLVATAATLLREFRVDRATRTCVAVVLGTLPAVANIAVTAKGDIFSAWMLLLALLGVVRYWHHRGGAWFWFALSAIALGVLSRLSNLPYSAVLALVACALALRRALGGRVAELQARGARIFVATGTLAAFVLARSLLLAGIFFVAPNGIVTLQERLGMTRLYPVGGMPPEGQLLRVPFPSGLWDLWFSPQGFPHQMITWIGNAWAWLPVALLVLGLFRWPRQPAAGLLLCIGAIFFALMFGYPLPVLGGDGNYFIVPLACLLLWGAVATDTPADAVAVRAWRGGLLALALGGMAISFVTGSWGPGTRPFAMEWRRVPFEMREHAAYQLKSSGMMGVANFFAASPPGTRVVGLEKTMDAPPQGWWLKVRYEALQPYAWQQPDLVASPEALRAYLERARIEYVIEPMQVPESGVAATWAMARDRMIAAGRMRAVYRDAGYVVWGIARYDTFRSALGGNGYYAQVQVPEGALCQHEPVVAQVAWSLPAPVVAVDVRSPTSGDASLFAEGGGSGAATTGPWVASGARFLFRNGRSGPVLADIAVTARCSD